METKPIFVVLHLVLVEVVATTSSIWRLPARELVDYRAYRDVTILHYRVPSGAHLASWNFTCSERLVSYFVTGCTARNITINLKPGSYPVVNPSGARFPANYSVDSNSTRLPHLTLQFLSDGVPNMINITSPEPGDWFATAYVSYTDPENDEIRQQGLSPNCAAMLESSLVANTSVQINDILPDRAESGEVAVGEPKYYKVYVPEGIWMLQVTVNIDRCDAPCPDITVLCSPRVIPTVNNSSSCNVSAGDNTCSLVLVPSEGDYHYISINADAVKDDVPEYSVNNVSFTLVAELLGFNETFRLVRKHYPATHISPFSYLGHVFDCYWTELQLMRQSFSAFFTFNFMLAETTSQWELERGYFSANVSTEAITTMKIEVMSIADIGGTLTSEIKLEESVFLKNSTKTPFNVTVVACLNYRNKAKPVYDRCISYMSSVEASMMRVNSTSESARYGSIHVPYPESGQWYLTLMPFCYSEAEESIDCRKVGLAHVNVSLILESNMCTPDACGRYGSCLNYMSGGLVFSTCVCRHGYVGWGCTDNSRVSSLHQLLLAALLLTLSNLPFLGAVAVALKRRYITEAFVYASTAFFSTFYHACDAGEDIYSYCMLRSNVLQFCDFYSAILSVWVTLVAMADLPPTAKSLAHMVGAVGIALGTEHSRTSLWMLVVPALVGITLVLQSWGRRCRERRACYPNRHYWRTCFPAGLFLVVLGLICYSFLQTRQNYKFVHSGWHIVMAIAIVFLLPTSKHLKVVTPPEADSEEASITLPAPASTTTTMSWLRDNKFFKRVFWWTP